MPGPVFGCDTCRHLYGAAGRCTVCGRVLTPRPPTPSIPKAAPFPAPDDSGRSPTVRPDTTPAHDA